MPNKITNLVKSSIFLLFLVFTFSSVFAQEIPSDEAVIAAGESTYKANCTQCHQIHKQIIGPALANVYERRSIEWLNAWIKNSQAEETCQIASEVFKKARIREKIQC